MHALSYHFHLSVANMFDLNIWASSQFELLLIITILLLFYFCIFFLPKCQLIYNDVHYSKTVQFMSFFQMMYLELYIEAYNAK